MKVLVFEDNLFWSARLQKTLFALGHECEVLTALPEDDRGARAALVNLGSGAFDPNELVPGLKALGLYVIGHAGHKEVSLRKLGKEAGCDRIASNSEMTFKLAALLEEAEARIQ
jgi:hypothetical protein